MFLAQGPKAIAFSLLYSHFIYYLCHSASLGIADWHHYLTSHGHLSFLLDNLQTGAVSIPAYPKDLRKMLKTVMYGNIC